MVMGKKILVIDDEPDLLKIATFRLKRSGYDILTAVDGREAVDILKNETPDLILLDLRLPAIDGYEICRRVKSDERTKNIPVILFTASATASVADRIKETGANDCLIKPFEPETLLEKVKKLIG